jgi:hypothetical protein
MLKNPSSLLLSLYYFAVLHLWFSPFVRFCNSLFS